jgi:hypothetical protein
MREGQKQVNKFIEGNFQFEFFEIEDFPFFPYGKLLTDRKGEIMVVYYDIMSGIVATAFE